MEAREKNLSCGTAEFDWEEARQIVGASVRQMKFCQARLAGASMTKAARMAGYQSATDMGMRSQGAQTEKSSKVQSLMALAMARGAGVVDEVLTVREAKSILSQMARRGNATTKIPAIKALRELEADEVNAKPVASIGELIAALAARHGEPFGRLISVLHYLAATVPVAGFPTLVGFPNGAEVLPRVQGEFPGFWADIQSRIPPHHQLDHTNREAKNGKAETQAEATD